MLAVAGAFLSSCYEDKGNYDYDESIIEVPVSLEKSYGVKKEKTKFTYTITPQINVPNDYKKNLSYEWYVNTSSANSKGELHSNDKSLTLEMDPESSMDYSYYIRLYVTDNVTGAITMQPTSLEVIKPYTFSWLVLHETDNHAEVGSVEYMGGNMLVTPDAYTKGNGKSLSGKPLNLSCAQAKTSWRAGSESYDAQSLVYLTTTDEEESGIINPTNDFALFSKWSEMLNPTQKEAYFDPNHIVYSGSSYGGYGYLMTSKGKVFKQRNQTPVMYLMNPQSSDEELLKDYYVNKLAAGPHVGLGFDETTHRFICFYLQKGDYWYEFTYEPEPYNGGPIGVVSYHADNAMDPSKPIPADQNIVAIFNGYHYGISGIAPWQRYTIYAYTIAGSRSYVYPFQCYGLTNPAYEPSLPDYYEFTTPDGINENTLMTTGNRFNNILFYAVKNKVYRLDASSGNSTLIYQHEDPNAVIADLRMACEGLSFDTTADNSGEESYGVPFNRCLGIGVNCSDGTGELVVLQLGTNGRILEDKAKYPSIQVHRGFGPIKNIVFI